MKVKVWWTDNSTVEVFEAIERVSFIGEAERPLPGGEKHVLLLNPQVVRLVELER